MAYLPSDIRGPKLFPFTEDFANAQFIRLLSSEDNDSSGETSHARVFQVIIGKKRYAVKIFNFVPLEDIRPFVPTKEHLITDTVVRQQLDPFFAECRAFGLLTEKGKDDELAVHCHGYVLLSEEIEHLIEEKFGIRDWNRSAEDEGKPLRAIVKNYIRFLSFDRPKKLAKMRVNLKQLNKMGIYNMDIRKENYLGGHLFDFSLAITLPHLSFSRKFRSERQIKDDMKFDLACFDSLVKHVNKERTKVDRMNRKRWKSLRSRSTSRTRESNGGVVH
ncbi:kinetochore Sim4 complex subunit FTA2-domain-containing protein [Annulohypoxylon truncatum]|uniref:kinetochore Sim4 complex subunit FTA2-domain-containing protein n=1 Tax=Annulohypoxylon truncatum TaxID=327061 RepID=UPI002007404F|nr:kinetochore Sim4 complex subunit FTA2-domain-containing protein [Annulohypoxylon truncatum]KAI1212632.1 kinetochore Sim4 complex subunit FTA2-domain-containing protein [Annulohypoxylon truncatum]